MVSKKFRKAINEYADTNELEIKILDNHAYDRSVVGVTTDGRLIYDYDKMVKEFMKDEDCDFTEAEEWIQYNTLRALPYFGENAPIIIYNINGILKYYGD